MSSLCVFVYLLHLHLYYSLPWNTVSEINQMKKRVYYCHHWRRLGESVGGGVGALAPKIFFIRPPKCEIWGGTAGDSLLLGTKCWLSIIMY